MSNAAKTDKGSQSIRGAIPAGDILSPLHGQSVLAWMGAFVLLAIAVVLRLNYTTTPDVSWLLSVGERFLAGERLYVDIIEVNPPASVYLYLPALLLAKYIGGSPELWVGSLVFAAIFASLFLSISILQRSVSAHQLLCAPVALSALYVLAIMPGETFAQREHIAVICILPWLALATIRIESRSPSIGLAFAVGVCGGVFFAIKPLFVVPMLMVFVTVLVARKSWRCIFFPEYWTAAGVAVLYVAYTFYMHPEFWRDTMPLLNALYIPLRIFDPLWQTGHFTFWSIAILAVLASRPGLPAQSYSWLLIAASAGFCLVCIWQGKFWSYHFYPMMALAVLAGSIATTEIYRRGVRQSHPLVRLGWLLQGTVVLVVAGRLWASFGPQEDNGHLARAVARIASNPSIILLSHDLALGHPATRLAGGRRVDSFCCIWIAAHANLLRASAQGDQQWLQQIDDAMAMQVDVLQRDIARRKPDVLIAEPAALVWARRYPQLASEIAAYETAETVVMQKTQREVLVLRRKMSPG